MQEQGWKITYVFEEIFLGYLGFCPMNMHKIRGLGLGRGLCIFPPQFFYTEIMHFCAKFLLSYKTHPVWTLPLILTEIQST